MGATKHNANKQPVTAETITSDQIRALRHDHLIDTETCVDAIYNNGSDARERCADAYNHESLVCLEACS